MERAFDIVVRGGTVVDGTGSAAFEADVAIKDGRIVAVGAIQGAGALEIDAKGQLVTPGFVDIHTHYDGQATWDTHMQPTSWHGVTTAVMGNCGVGFAPCKPADRERLMRLMEGVEDIPFPVLTEGLPWNWETYAEYLDSLSGRRFDMDLGSLLPHAPVRVWVMGERGANREAATEDDIRAMAVIARQAIEAGALGFSTSKTLNHRTKAGEHTPTLAASEDELTGIAMGLKAAGGGIMEYIGDYMDPVEEFAMLRRLVEATGRPVSFGLAQITERPGNYRVMLDKLGEALAAGLPMSAQAAPRAIGILFGLELTLNPFLQYPAWAEIQDMPLNEKVARLRDPGFRARLLAEHGGEKVRVIDLQDWSKMFLMGEEPDYEQHPDHTVAAIAARTGRAPAEVALEHMLTQEGRGVLYLAFANYMSGNLDVVREMLSHRAVAPGLGDGGAHVGTICDGSFPTTMLTHWTRDRTRGPKLPLEEMVRKQTSFTAGIVGLNDRGVIAPGYRADLNVIDYDRLRLLSPQVAYDLPKGGRRLVQRAEGYTATIVAGEVTYRDGQPTGALPGRLVRGAKSGPVALAAE
ncbi:MAG: amidohydrolase family protein [Phenylobacterium sp.]|nr:amidohydrolase family protein [Phenylobacterium sp.]